MAVRKESIEVSVKGADQGARSLDKLGRSADDAGDDIKGLGKSFVPYVSGAKRAEAATDALGDEFDRTSRKAAQLEHQLSRLGRARARVGGLFGRDGGGSALGTAAGLAGAAGSAGSGGARAALGGLSLPLSPGALAGVGAGAAVALPAIGAGISMAGLLAGGGLVAGGGAALAASSSERVQSSYSLLGQQIAADATKAAKAFEKPLLESADIVRAEWRSVSGDVERMFTKAADGGGLQGFTKGLTGFVREILPGLEKATEVFGDFGEIARQSLPELGKSLSVMFGEFERGSAGATAFFADLLELSGEAAENIGHTAMALSKVYEFLDEGRDRSAYGQLTQGVTGFSKAIDQGTTGAEAFHKVMEQGAKEIESYQDQLDRLVETTLDLVGANLNYEESLDEMASTLRENGKQWSATNDAGRENIRVVKESIEAAYAQRNSMIATGQSAAYADVWFKAAKDSIIAQAKAAGATAAVIAQLTAQWDAFLKMPSTKILNVKVVESSSGRVGSGAARAGTLPFYAAGTPSARAGYAVVGEEGPEIVKFRGGEQVIPHAETMSMSQGRREPVLVRVRVEYPDGRVAREQLIDAAADRGQSIGAFLGV